MKKNSLLRTLIIIVLVLASLWIVLQLILHYAVQKWVAPKFQQSVERQISTQLSEKLEMPVDASKRYIPPTLTDEQKALEEEVRTLTSSADETHWPQAALKYLDGCIQSPKTGYNALLKFPDEVGPKARSTLLQEFRVGDRDRRRCAVSVLSRGIPNGELDELWRELLVSNDQQLRWWGIVNISKGTSASDIDLVARQVVEAPELRDVVASALRGWNDRKVIPVLNDLSHDQDEWTRKRAIRSIEESAFVTDYRQSKLDSFAGEVQWWNKLKASASNLSLDAPWKRDGDVIAK